MQKKITNFRAIGLLVALTTAALIYASSSAHALSLNRVSNICGFEIPQFFRSKWGPGGWARFSSSDWHRAFCAILFRSMEVGCRNGIQDRAEPRQVASWRKDMCNTLIPVTDSRAFKRYNSNLFSPHDFYAGRGMAYNALGEYDSAIADLTTAIESRRFPFSSWYFARALAYYSTGRYDAALADADRAVDSSRVVPEGPRPQGRFKKYGFDVEHPARNVLIDPQKLDDVETSLFNETDAFRRKNFTHVDEAYSKGIFPTLQKIKEKARQNLFGGNEMRGDIALAKKDYKLALRYYEHYSIAFPEKAGLAEKIALTRKMMDLAKRGEPLPPSQPGSPSPLPPACKMYPNLC